MGLTVPAQEREKCFTVSKAGRAYSTKHFDIRSIYRLPWWASVFLWSNISTLCPHLEWECLFHVIVYWHYVFYLGLLSWVSEEIWTFKLCWDCERPWGFLKLVLYLSFKSRTNGWCASVICQSCTLQPEYLRIHKSLSVISYDLPTPPPILNSSALGLGWPSFRDSFLYNSDIWVTWLRTFGLLDAVSGSYLLSFSPFPPPHMAQLRLVMSTLDSLS